MPRAQAAYLQYLLQKATDSAIKAKRFAFDPQGRILIDVTLTAEDYAKIPPPGSTKVQLEAAMGRKITDTTTVSLDIQDIPALKNQQTLSLRTELNALQAKKPVKDLSQTIRVLNALEKTPKGSIIGLQQEFHFHLNLVARTCQQVLGKKAFPDDKKDAALNDTLLRINQLVMKAYAEALDAAYADGVIDVAQLNSRLDGARKEITKVAHSLLRHEMEKRGVTIARETSFDAIAEKITATPNDLVHTTSELGLVTLIEGSESTAHHRVRNETFANREILTQKYARDPVTGACRVSETVHPRIQIRTPSLDLKDKEITEPKEIEDIALKMGHVIKHYHLQDKLPAKGDGIPKAYVYNLHTAVNGWTSQEGKNKQTRGAQRILKASHEANAKQLKDNPDDPVFCFVQNISVNGFGDALGPMNPVVRGVRWLLRYDNAVQDEATIMADMALMHTLYDKADPAQQAKIKDVMQQYKTFLDDPKRPAYFIQSAQATKAAQIISEIKADWKTQPAVASSPQNVVDNAKAALRYLVANNLHYSHEYAKLAQTLSIFVEDASIAGCKSGNERAQAISGRVTILDALANNSDFLLENLELATTLQNLATGKDVAANVDKFKTSLDQLYNSKGLQTATSLISMVDQGAAAKVEPKQGYFYRRFVNTNYGEESADVMSNLKQSKAGAMQAHGGLTHAMEKTWQMVRGKNEQVVALSGVKPLKEKENIQQIKDRLIGQIGQYGADDFQVSSILSPDGVKALHKQVDAYQESSDHNDDPEFHRKKFIEYLFSHASQERMGLSAQERLAFLDAGNPKGAAVKMEHLLDKTGIRLYQAALTEERCSKKFMQATLKASTEHHDGEKWSQRMVVPLGGPSASGKTFGATSVVAKAAEFMPKVKGDKSGNDVVSVDGAVPREVSQMRKLMIQYAVNLGYTGITNLHGKSKSLGSVKEDIAQAAFKTPGLNMVIPETFADPRKAPALIVDLAKLKNAKVIFARVDSSEESFRPTVAFNGNKRAWKSDTDPIPDYDLNMAKKHLPESKDYEGEHFEDGRKGTSLAQSLFAKFFPKMMKINIVYGLVLVKQVGNDWVEADGPGRGVDSYSKIVFDAWKQLPPEERQRRPFPAFHKEESGKISGAVIKTEEQISLESTAFKLEKRMQAIGETRVQPIVDQIRDLHGLFKQSKWEEYQNSIDIIRLNIKAVLELPRPLPTHAIEKLEKLNVKLEKARGNVPEAFKKDAPTIVMPTDRTLMAKTSILGFEREVMPSGTSSDDLLKHAKVKDTDGTRLDSESNMTTECQGVVLKEGEHICSYLKFSEDHTGLLVQNHRGRVDNFSSSNLTPEERVAVAIEQAQMMLINWKPNCGPVIIKGKNEETANMVYAALLLLKDCDKRFKDLTIKSWVPNCTGPSKFEFQSTFINRHLGNEKDGVLTADLRDSLKKETAELVASKSSEFLKDKLQKKAKPEAELPPDESQTLQTR